MKLIAYFCFLLIIFFSSCGTPQNIVYLQDIQEGQMLAVQELQAIKIHPGDKLNIIVSARDQELANMFNITGPGSSGGSGSDRATYTVNDKGQIDFPILGFITVQGLTRMEVASIIKYQLLASQMIKDPTVIVEYANMGFTALGAIGSPGWVNINRDHVNILEAIALAGDLSINGERENVLVLRTVNGKQTPYRIDLTDVASVYSSPVYYLQQGDILYVQPNETMINQSTPMGNSWRTPTFWISMFTSLMAIGLYFVK